ncbi:hypothetical protein [Cupriavidus basilensis]|uniref:hypothetical protein n=1 Tax=Cupriavidus basilensis TaxID=68895 RepID=UPI0023E88D5B|nr:hypothetical protein [Cupriavidus basilensis]MDF3885976.1 hypothetical protein [Cupriavidus basilensis]
MMPAASLHGMHENERQILSEHLEHLEHLDRLQSGGLRSIGRGYPARWLIAGLNQRHVPLYMRADQSRCRHRGLPLAGVAWALPECRDMIRGY